MPDPPHHATRVRGFAALPPGPSRDEQTIAPGRGASVARPPAVAQSGVRGGRHDWSPLRPQSAPREWREHQSRAIGFAVRRTALRPLLRVAAAKGLEARIIDRGSAESRYDSGQPGG